MACKSQLTLSLLACAAICTTPVPAATFGSNNDGLGGFTQSALDTGVTWTTNADSVQYSSSNTGTLNSSFLGSFVLDRTPGNIYTATGVVTLTDGYADDNNRVGIYLFGDANVVPDEDEAGALGIIFNMDDNVVAGPPGDNADDNLAIRVGIDNTTLGGPSARNENTTAYAQDLFGTQVTLSATFAFVGTDIEVSATLTDADGDVTTVAPITVAAADYTGDYFGFVTRARSRNNGVQGDPRSNPWVMDYESFNITVVPEPASLALLGIGGLCVIRRRR